MKLWKVIGITALVIVLIAFPIFSVVVYVKSKSPDDFSSFPTSGVWVCETDDFTMMIDLTDVETHVIYDGLKTTITIGDNTYDLDFSVTGGHGTIFVPVATQTILCFKSDDIDSDSENFVNFQTSKYKFNEYDFYLLSIYCLESHQFSALQSGMQLHFFKMNNQ